nr:50S ribosomal protein L15 [uncultured Dethiosulfovibrio sp.]
MNLNDLHPAPGTKRKAKRVGCGIGCGNGKTSGRGHKGQKSRSGGGVRPGFEGGQMPLVRRTPKRGFSNFRFGTSYQVINLDLLEDRFDAGSVVTAIELEAKRLIRSKDGLVKVLAKGDLTKALTVRANAFSAEAIKKIESAGGKAEVI